MLVLMVMVMSPKKSVEAVTSTCPEHLTIPGECKPESEIIPISLPIPVGWEDISDIYVGYNYRVSYAVFPDMGKWESIYSTFPMPEGFPDDYMIMIVKYDIITVIPDSFGRTFYFKMSYKPFLFCDQRVIPSGDRMVTHGSIHTGHRIELATTMTGGWYPPKSGWEAWRLPKCDIPGISEPNHNNTTFEFVFIENE